MDVDTGLEWIERRRAKIFQTDGTGADQDDMTRSRRRDD